MKLEANELERHTIGVALPVGAYMDAGRAGDLGGLELAVEPHVRISEPNPRHPTGAAVLSITGHPGSLEQLAHVILDKVTNTPAFTEREWLEIAGVLRSLHASNLTPYADRIEQAYGR